MARHIKQRTLTYTRRSPERTQARQASRPVRSASAPEPVPPAPPPVPADPTPALPPAAEGAAASARLTRWLIAAGVVLVLVGTVVVWLTSGLAPAAVVLVLGLGLALLMNPSIWSSRARGGAPMEQGHPPEQPDNEARYQ